jgi:hypothetical protein
MNDAAQGISHPCAVPVVAADGTNGMIRAGENWLRINTIFFATRQDRMEAILRELIAELDRPTTEATDE